MIPLSAVPRRMEIAGTPVDFCSFREVIDRIIHRARAGGPPAYIVTPNAHHVTLFDESERFRRVYRDAWLSLADGTPLIWASKLVGTPIPEKVSGSDLFPALCKAVAGTDLRIFLMGGMPGAAETAARVLTERYPGLQIVGTSCPPRGFETDPAESARLLETIKAAKPHVLFVALGAPKQEYWMHDNHALTGVPVSIGVGGSFEFVAGMVKRAPKWMRKAGLEWFYRLSMEPRRLWKRYLVTNPRFMWLVAKQYAGRNTAGNGTAPSQ